MIYIPSIIIIVGIALFVGFRGGYFKFKKAQPVDTGVHVNMQAAILVRETLRKSCIRCFYFTQNLASVRNSATYKSLMEAGFAPMAIKMQDSNDIKNFIQRYGRGLHMMLVFDHTVELKLVSNIEDYIQDCLDKAKKGVMRYEGR